MTRIDVDCGAESDGWTCAVEVVDEGSRSHHTVRVNVSELARLHPTAADPIDLVRRSFIFLLQRESKESILSSFDLTVISRYFPEYEATISERAR